MTFSVRMTDDLVAEDALVRVIDAIVDRLDFAAFERQYPGGGKPAFHPRFIGKLVIFGICNSVLSARELSRRLDFDTRFMWLAHETRVDHEVFSDFRRRFKEPLKDLFKDTVKLARELGLLSLGHVAIDGSKIAASAKRSALNKHDIDKALARTDELIEKLLAEAEALDAADDAKFGPRRGDEIPKELANARTLKQKLEALLPAAAEEPEQRFSLTDVEAPLQKTQDGKRPGYNVQIAVDEKVGFIVAQDVTCEQNDTGQFAPLAQQAIANLEQMPQTIVADSGYHSAEALEYLAENSELNAYINQQPSPTPDLYGHEHFEYDASTDTYRCPAGARLIYRGDKTLRNQQWRHYRAEHTCAHCEQRARCYSGKMAYRELLIAPHGHLSVAMKHRLKSDAGQQALQTRKQTVERTFGTIKVQLGLRQFLTRGLAGVQNEFCLAAIGVNVRKLAAWIRTAGWTPAPAAASG